MQVVAGRLWVCLSGLVGLPPRFKGHAMNQPLFFLPSQPFSISHHKLLPSHTVLSLQPWGLSTVDCWVIWTQNTRTPSLAPTACSQELAGEPGLSLTVPGSGKLADGFHLCREVEQG